MQPLSVAVNGPFKQKLPITQNDWLVCNPGKTITIHNLVGIVTPAYTTTYIARNIVAGFSTPAIYPFSWLTFCNDNFQSAEVTNCPFMIIH